MVTERRKPKTKAQTAAELHRIAEAKVVAWADRHGAPLIILIGWNPDTGEWDETSPVGRMLALIRTANFPGTAAKAAGLPGLAALLAKGNEYRIEAPEDRAYIPVDVRPFIDLVVACEVAEAESEIDLVDTTRRGTVTDPKLALALLGRRFATRWREQQAIFTTVDVDERDRAVSDALNDPNLALRLATAADEIEDRTTTGP